MYDHVPCLGCGFCCSQEMCRTGALLYGHYRNPCPALVRDGSRYLCSLYLSDPLRYEAFLEIGAGCCLPSNPRRAEAAEGLSGSIDVADTSDTGMTQ